MVLKPPSEQKNRDGNLKGPHVPIQFRFLESRSNAKTFFYFCIKSLPTLIYQINLHICIKLLIDVLLKIVESWILCAFFCCCLNIYIVFYLYVTYYIFLFYS